MTKPTFAELVQAYILAHPENTTDETWNALSYTHYYRPQFQGLLSAGLATAIQVDGRLVFRLGQPYTGPDFDSMVLEAVQHLSFNPKVSNTFVSSYLGADCKSALHRLVDSDRLIKDTSNIPNTFKVKVMSKYTFEEVACAYILAYPAQTVQEVTLALSHTSGHRSKLDRLLKAGVLKVVGDPELQQYAVTNPKSRLSFEQMVLEALKDHHTNREISGYLGVSTTRMLLHLSKMGKIDHVNDIFTLKETPVKTTSTRQRVWEWLKLYPGSTAKEASIAINIDHGDASSLLGNMLRRGMCTAVLQTSTQTKSQVHYYSTVGETYVLKPMPKTVPTAEEVLAYLSLDTFTTSETLAKVLKCRAVEVSKVLDGLMQSGHVRQCSDGYGLAPSLESTKALIVNYLKFHTSAPASKLAAVAYLNLDYTKNLLRDMVVEGSLIPTGTGFTLPISVEEAKKQVLELLARNGKVNAVDVSGMGLGSVDKLLGGMAEDGELVLVADGYSYTRPTQPLSKVKQALLNSAAYYGVISKTKARSLIGRNDPLLALQELVAEGKLRLMHGGETYSYVGEKSKLLPKDVLNLVAKLGTVSEREVRIRLEVTAEVAQQLLDDLTDTGSLVEFQGSYSLPVAKASLLDNLNVREAYAMHLELLKMFKV